MKKLFLVLSFLCSFFAKGQSNGLGILTNRGEVIMPPTSVNATPIVWGGNMTLPGSGVTSITAGIGMTGGTITATGTVAVANPVYTATVSLTSVMILTLNTTPVTIIAAPGAGKVIIPVSIIVNYTYGTVAYATNTNLLITEGGSLLAGLTASFLTSSTSYIRIPSPFNTVNGTTTQGFGILTDNGALAVTVNSGNPTAGDGTMKITIQYIISSD